MRKILIVLTAFTLLLSACAAASSTPAATLSPQAPATSVATPYPAPSTQIATAYPAQSVQQPGDAYPAPQATQSNAPQAYPPDATTNIAIVDQVIKAALAPDHSGLAALVHFSTLACTKKEGLGGPPKCLASEADGTPVDVLPALSSEGGHLRKNAVNAATFKGQYALLAAFNVKTPAHVDPDYPSGKYALVFSASGTDQSTSIVTLHIDDQGIVRMDNEGAISDTILSQVGEFILPLKMQ